MNFKKLRLVKNGKTPLVAGAFYGEEDSIVQEWIAQGGNYGVLTGSINNICVIDIDTHHGVDGMSNLKEFLSDYDIKLTQTYTIKTPSGGMHLYYRLPEEYNEIQFMQNLPNLDGVDFQTHGRYVVGEGSSIDGIKYQSRNDYELSDIPQKWLDLFKDKSMTSKNNKRERKWTAHLLGDIIKGVDGGGRNIWLTGIIGKLFATGLNHDEVRTWALYANQIGANPPLEESEVLRTYDSVRKREIRRMEND